MILAGVSGVLVFGLLFVLLHEYRPFGILPPIVEAVLLAPIMPSIILVSIASQSRFNHVGYVRANGRTGVLKDLLVAAIGCACFGVVVGLLGAFVEFGQSGRLISIAVVEYFSAIWIFAMANNQYYDTKKLRQLFDR